MKPFLSFLLAPLFLVWGCHPSQENYKPASSGKTSEVILVMANTTAMAQAQATVRLFFEQTQEGLNQPEALYTVIPIAPSAFSKLFQSHANILMVEIDSTIKKPLIEAKKDMWASPQQVFRVTVASPSDFISLFDLKKELFLAEFKAVERARILNAYDKVKDVVLIKDVKKKIGLQLELPQGFFIATSTPTFMWLRKETAKYSQGILFYTEPYTDTLQLKQPQILAKRNQITKAHIPGPREGSYMITDTFVHPTTTYTPLQGYYAMETRGLWRLQGDFMGGPYVHYTYVDTISKQLITLEGYVYAPNAKKRDYLMQVEAIIHSLKK